MHAFHSQLVIVHVNLQLSDQKKLMATVQLHASGIKCKGTPLPKMFGKCIKYSKSTSVEILFW